MPNGSNPIDTPPRPRMDETRKPLNAWFIYRIAYGAAILVCLYVGISISAFMARNPLSNQMCLTSEPVGVLTFQKMEKFSRD